MAISGLSTCVSGNERLSLLEEETGVTYVFSHGNGARGLWLRNTVVTYISVSKPDRPATI